MRRIDAPGMLGLIYGMKLGSSSEIVKLVDAARVVHNDNSAEVQKGEEINELV